MAEILWCERSFSELTAADLYALLRLRSNVFVVEQNCVFEDMDGKDFQAAHLLGFQGETLVAYARLFAPGDYYEQAAIGRVVTDMTVRGTGVGRQLMVQAIGAVERRWGPVSIRIGAQAHLERFYASLGFVRDGENYIEDGIPHLHMIRR